MSRKCITSQGRIHWGAIGAIAPLKLKKVTLFSMILYNSENNVRNVRPFCRPQFCHSSVVKYTSSLAQKQSCYKAWRPNITEITPLNLLAVCTPATSLIRRQNHNGEVLDRSWLCFYPSQTCGKYFICRLMCADTTKRRNVRISLLEKAPSTGSTLLKAWGATSIQWNIQMPRLELVADVINHYDELIQN